MAAPQKRLPVLAPKVPALAGGAGLVGESNTPLNTGLLVNGPGGTPDVNVPAPSASQMFGSLPKPPPIAFDISVEAQKKPYTLCVTGSTNVGATFVFGKVVPGGTMSSGSVIPLANGDQTVSLTRAL